MEFLGVPIDVWQGCPRLPDIYPSQSSQKSDLTPVQDLVYFGGWFRMDLALIILPDPRKDTLISCVLSFGKVGSYKPVHQFLQLLCLMAATLLVVGHAHLRMGLIQWYLKDQRSGCHSLNHLLLINSNLVQALQWWTVFVSWEALYALASHCHCHHGCQYGRVWRPCPGVGITFHPLSKALGPGGEVAPFQYF